VLTEVPLPSMPTMTVPSATLASTAVLPGTLLQAAMTSSVASTVVPTLRSGTHRPVLGMPLVVPAVTQALNLPTRSLSAVPSDSIAISLFKQPPAFKELRERESKFSGKCREDFEVWLADYCEATGDCG